MISSYKGKFDENIIEKAVLEGDLVKFSPIEKVKYVRGICNTLGLNPTTMPIKIMKFQGKETIYFTKDASEQLRKINKVSINKLENVFHGEVYIVTAYAMLPDGRIDSSTGAISTKGLVGEGLANALMKAETKAKRRVTLSICGLGFIDESEVDSIPGAKKISINLEENEDTTETTELLGYDKCLSDDEFEKITQLFKFYCDSLKSSNDFKSLEMAFKGIDLKKFKDYPDMFQALIDLKDKRKIEMIEGDEKVLDEDV